MTRRAAVFVLVVVVSFGAACVRRTPQPVGPTGDGGGGDVAPPPTGDPLADALAARHADLTAHAYRVVGSAVRGQLAPGALTAYPIDAQAGTCYVAFALAQNPAADFDLFVYDDDGVEIARHVASAAVSSAWIGFCPPRAGRYSVHVHAYAGGGEYVYALYEGSAPAEGLDQAFAVRATPSPAAGQGAVDPAILPKVERSDRRLSRDGFARAGGPSGATFGRRETRTVGAMLEQGRCYALVALAGARGQDVDLTLLSPGGQRVERDDRRSRDAEVQHCPIVAGQFTLEIKLDDGQGPVWLLGYVRGGAAPAGPVVSFDAPVAAAPVAIPAPIDGARHQVDHELRARGYEPVGPPASGQLAEGASASHEVALEGGRCYALTAAGDLPVTGVELAVFDRTTEMARDPAGGPFAVARVCPQHAVRVRADVRAVAGAGGYELRSWVWPGSTQGPFGLSGAIFVRLSEATNVLGRDGFEPTTAPALADARQNVPVRADVQLTPGSCYALVATGGPGVRDLEVSLLAGATVLGTARPNEPVAIVRRCVQAAAAHRVEIRVTRGAGQVLHQVFALAAAQPADPGAAAPAAP